MILLNQNQSLEIITTSSAKIDYNITINNFDAQGNSTSWQPLEGSITSAGSTLITNNNTTIQQISFISLRNSSGSVSNTLTVSRVSRDVAYPITPTVDFAFGEYGNYNSSTGWLFFNAQGFEKFVGEQGPIGPSGVVQTIVAGTNVTVDNTDPANPIVNATPSSSVAWGDITGTLSDQTDLQTALDGKVDENATITGATKTKITYDAKGLVTAGADATTADIADSTNKRYVTDANLTVINNTSGVNTGDQNLTPYFNKSVDDSDDIAEGITNLFWTNARTIASVLTGLSVTGSTILSTDTILQAFGKTQNQINSLVGGVNYQGSWNANTNTPALVSSVGTKGYYYVVSVAGTTSLDGITDWQLGDWAIFNGSVWQKIDNTDAVISVNGYGGIVVLTTADIADSTNKRYVTDAQLSNISSLPNISGNAATVTTNANLTGVVTSVGNTTAIANGAITNAMLANAAVSDLTGSNSGDNAINTRYEGLVSGPTYSTGTSVFDFGTEQDHIVNTISYTTVTTANFRGITFLPTGTSETSLDDFTLNGVTFAIENIVDGVSFDIRASSINLASGNYTIKYQIATSN